LSVLESFVGGMPFPVPVSSLQGDSNENCASAQLVAPNGAVKYSLIDPNSEFNSSLEFNLVSSVYGSDRLDLDCSNHLT
jgi:hypothetical protein